MNLNNKTWRKRFFKFYLMLIMLTFIGHISINAQSNKSLQESNGELLIFELNRPVNVVDRGFPKSEMIAIPSKQIDAMAAGSNEDWTTPINYSQGTLFMRVEIFSQPVIQNNRLQFCIWQNDLKGDRFGLETCASLANVSGTKGTVVTWSQPVQNMWKKDKISLDWTRPRERYGIAIKNTAGDPVSDYNGWNWNGENPDEWYPLNMHFTVVAVPPGATFSGWSNYIGNPLSADPSQKADLAFPSNLHSFNVFPNNGSGLLNFEFVLEKSATVEAGIYSVNGDKIKTLLNRKLEARNYNESYDISELPVGIYLIAMIQDNTTLARHYVKTE